MIEYNMDTENIWRPVPKTMPPKLLTFTGYRIRIGGIVYDEPSAEFMKAYKYERVMDGLRQ